MRKVIPIICLCCLASCNKSADPGPVVMETDFAVLNNGMWGENNACISLYDLEKKTVSERAFQKANGVGLGSLGQDMLVCGGELYIAVNESQIVFVTDMTLKIKRELTATDGNGTRLSPHCLAEWNGKIYVSYYEGYVGEISPSEGYALRITPSGPNPEGLACAGGKLFVANSGGLLYPEYNNTVSVIDLSEFKETSTITVNPNPIMVTTNSDGTIIYVSSYGNYADAPPLLQSISASDFSVKTLDYEGVSSIASGDNDKLYVLCAGYDEDWNQLPGVIYMHDAGRNEKMGRFTDTDIPNAYSISADSGYVFAGSSDYLTNGEVYVFNGTGILEAEFDSGGLNPLKTICLDSFM